MRTSRSNRQQQVHDHGVPSESLRSRSNSLQIVANFGFREPAGPLAATDDSQMQQSPTQIVQSIWLRFWNKSSQSKPKQWRGTDWHEQQNPGEKPRPVAGPEEAFELVRRALDLPSGLETAKHPPTAHALED